MDRLPAPFRLRPALGLTAGTAAALAVAGLASAWPAGWPELLRWLLVAGAGAWAGVHCSRPRPAAEAPPPAAEAAESLWTPLVIHSPDVITLTELETGRYRLVNPSFERVTGYAAREVIGRRSDEISIWVDPQERQRLVRALATATSVRNMPARFRARNGQVLHMQISASRFDADGQKLLVLYGHDVTESEQLRQEYETILDNAMVGVALTRDGRFQMVNPQLELMLGWPRGGLTGQVAHVVWPTVEDQVAARNRLLPLLANGGQVDEEFDLMRRDGSTFTCRIRAQVVDRQSPEAGTIWLAEDVTERRQMDQALAKARDDAQAASLAKSAFLANTSHELRTPLNALLGLARLARQPGVDEQRRGEYIAQISDSAETLSAIISDILDLSKIEAGKMHLDQLPFRLHELLRSLHEAYGALADTKGLTMRLAVDAGVPDVVVGDPVRVRQILSNYLNNALKFTQVGGVVLVVQQRSGQRLRFEVLDTGSGIPQEALPRLFTPFTQVDGSSNRRVGGTGLGLSICRELAQLMGGEVGVSSEPGAGSRFWAELPLPEASDTELDDSTAAGGLDPLVGAHVLMVEDNPVNMMISVALLEQWGAEVVQAQDGAEAIREVDRAQAAGRPFDVVLMDVQMPGMSGHEATRLLRQRYPREQLPIIALTAAALVSERNQALSEGMNDFLTKPIDPHRLRTALVRLLRQRGAAPEA